MHGSLQISIRQLDKTGRQRQISRQLDDRISKDEFFLDRKAGRNSTTQQQLDDKVQSGLRPSYKTRASCRQKSVPEQQPEKPQQHQPWNCQGSS